MSDTIFIEALDIQGIIGIYDWERTTKQTIRIDIEMPANAANAAGNDEIEDTINYKDVAKSTIALVEESSYLLVETLAETICSMLLERFAVDWVDLTVSKPGAVRGSKNVGINILRGVVNDGAQQDVYLALGSNMEPRKYLNQALRLLSDRFGPLNQSTVYQNKAVGFEGEDFLNLVVSFPTHEKLDTVRRACAQIEDDCGRVRGTEKFAPRTLDIDLLMFGDTVVHVGKTKLPRPELLKFPFMLRPLAELAGSVRHPSIGRPLADLWKQWEGDDHSMQPVNL